MKEIDEDYGSLLFEDETTSELSSQFNQESIEDDYGSMVFEDKGVTKETPQESIEEDFSNENIQDSEEIYRKQKKIEDAKPIVKEAIKEAVKIQKENFKLEVNEVLQDEVAYRLDKYDKRRRWRFIKERIFLVIKVILVIVIVLVVLSNSKMRTRLVILAENIKEITIDLLEGDEDVSSNKLVEDLTQ